MKHESFGTPVHQKVCFHREKIPEGDRLFSMSAEQWLAEVCRVYRSGLIERCASAGAELQAVHRIAWKREMVHPAVYHFGAMLRILNIRTFG